MEAGTSWGSKGCKLALHGKQRVEAGTSWEAKGTSWHWMGSGEWRLSFTGKQKIERGKLQGGMNQPSEKPPTHSCGLAILSHKECCGSINRTCTASVTKPISNARHQGPAMRKVVYTHQQERCAVALIEQPVKCMQVVCSCLCMQQSSHSRLLPAQSSIGRCH